MKSYFPFVRTINYVAAKDSLASLYACRIEFDLHGTKAMRTDQRLELIRADGVKMDTLLLWEQRRLAGDIEFVEPFIHHDERLLLAYLTLLSQGHMPPQHLPGQSPSSASRAPRAVPKSPRAT